MVSMRLAFGLIVAFVVSNGLKATADDASISERLRPEQRANVIIALRDGSSHPLVDAAASQARLLASSVDNLARPAQVAAATQRPSISNAGEATAHPQSQPSSEIALAAAATLTPATKPAVAPQPVVAFVTETANGGYVPTTTSAKPSAHPTPIPATRSLAWLYAHRYDAAATSESRSQDLAWQYAHRYDTRAGDDFRVPGVPVRSQVASPFDTRSGAFHGVRSNNGWSAVRVSVSIPCGVGHFAMGPGRNEVTGQSGLVDQETGYIYVGGWGAGARGAPVDAGLQKSSAQAEHDGYAMYWKYAENRPITSTLRFPCGGDVALELYPVTESLLVFSATGTGPNHKPVTLTVVQQTRPKDDGWVPSGGNSRDGIILKRMVSIAQASSMRNAMEESRWRNGSYFGVDSALDTTPRIVWRTCEIGRLTPPRIVPEYRPWTNAETWRPPALGIYSDWPPKDVISSKVGYCDAAGIALHG